MPTRQAKRPDDRRPEDRGAEDREEKRTRKEASLESVMRAKGYQIRRAETYIDIEQDLRDQLPVRDQRGTLLLDPEHDERVGAWTGEVIQPDMPTYYLTNAEDVLLAMLQCSEGNFVTVSLLWVPASHRNRGYGTLLAALAMREKARAGPFSCGGFITDVRALNIHHKLFKVSLPRIAEEHFDPDDVTHPNEVEDGKKAEAVARAILERL